MGRAQSQLQRNGQREDILQLGRHVAVDENYLGAMSPPYPNLSHLENARLKH